MMPTDSPGKENRPRFYDFEKRRWIVLRAWLGCKLAGGADAGGGGGGDSEDSAEAGGDGGDGGIGGGGDGEVDAGGEG
jgi:hypothetical protein